MPVRSQEEKLKIIDEQFGVSETIGHLRNIAQAVTKEKIDPASVNACCNCVAQINSTITVVLAAARFLSEK